MTYQATALVDSPLRYYRGGTTDIGSQGQNGTNVNSVLTGQAPLLTGDAQGSDSFNGTSQVITLPTTGLPTGASPFSMDVWLNMPVLAQPDVFGTVLGFGNYATNVALLQYRSNSDTFVLDYGPSHISSGTGAVAGDTYYLAVSYDGSTLTFYLGHGGSLTTVGSVTSLTLNMGSAFAEIGRDSAGAGDYYKGLSQERAIYGTALSSARFLAHYNAGITSGVAHRLLSDGGYGGVFS